MNLRRQPALHALCVTALLCVVLALTAAHAWAQDSKGPCLVPWPKQVQMGAGVLKLGQASRIVAQSDSLAPLAKVLSDDIYLATGVRLAAGSGPANAGDIALSLDPALKGANHVVAITDRVTIRAGNYTGGAMGTATLLQSLALKGNALTVPVMTVTDGPQSEYCGMMVDVARRYNSIDELRQCVVLCRLYKIQYLHLHLSDDQVFTFPSTAYPKLGTTSSTLDHRREPRLYKLDELKDLVRFADERGVTIVPEIEMPGHSNAMQREMPEAFGVLDPATGKRGGVGVINITNEEIYPVLETLIGEVCDVFKSSPYFHMGGDECYWPPFLASEEVKAYMAKTGLNHGQMVAKFVSRIKEIVQKRGKRLIVWEAFGGLDKDIIIMAWGGGHQSLIDQGYKIINVPWVPHVYYTPRVNYEWNIWMVGPEGCGKPTQMQKTDAVVKGVIGAQMVLWERLGEEAVRLTRWNAPARNEQVYNPSAGKTYEDFERRMKSTDVLLDKLLYNVRIDVTGLRKIEGAPVAGLTDKFGSTDQGWLQTGGDTLFGDVLKVTLVPLATRPGETIRYTLDDSEPTADSPQYTGPFTITEKQTKHWQPNVNYPAISEATISVRVFAGKEPRSMTRVARYLFDYIGKMPRKLNCRLFEVPDSVKKAPENFSGLKLLYRGQEPWINLRGMPHVRRPSRYAAVWEGTMVIDKAGPHEFRISGYQSTSQLFVDGKLVASEDNADGKQPTATLTLSAGAHPVKVTYFGASDLLDVRMRTDEKAAWKELELQVIAGSPAPASAK